MTNPRTQSRSLNTAVSGIITAAGTLTIFAGPQIGQSWNLTVAAVRIPGAILIPQCRIYMGSAATDDNLIDATYSGALNSTSRVAGFPLTNGGKIFAVWSGADVGARATLSIYGKVLTS
jgi:hypothetical protein